MLNGLLKAFHWLSVCVCIHARKNKEEVKKNKKETIRKLTVNSERKKHDVLNRINTIYKKYRLHEVGRKRDVHIYIIKKIV